MSAPRPAGRVAAGRTGQRAGAHRRETAPLSADAQRCGRVSVEGVPFLDGHLPIYMKTRLEGVSLQGKKGEAEHIRPGRCVRAVGRGRDSL